MELVDREVLEKTWASIAAKLTAARPRLVVTGPTGSGRSLVFQRLKEQGRFACVEPPPLGEPDAVLHALMQLAAHVGPDAVDFAQDSAKDLQERAAEVGRRLAASGTGVVLRLSSAWRFADAAEGWRDADRAIGRDRASELLAGLTKVAGLAVVLLAETRAGLPGDGSGWESIRLERMSLELPAAADLSAFGSYQGAAHDLAEACRKANVAPTPLQFRVTVALRALGRFEPRDVELLDRAGPGLQVLESRLFRALAGSKALARSVYRVALARRPLPREQVTALAGLSTDEAPLITECLAYGNGTVSMHDRVRHLVLQLWRDRNLRPSLRADEPAAHFALAKYHQALDGAPAATRSRSVVDWLERVHHLAGSGELGEQEWSSLELNCREFYWDRARALSFAGAHRAAAEVYRKSLERFGGKDAYAQHYLGFNLDRAGTEPAAAEVAFREAIDLDPGNPWWNGRLVTSLIGHAQFLAARREWRNALTRVDPDGERVGKDDWLGRHMHRWVVEAWLDHGQVELAREAFDAIPPELVTAAPELALLEQRLLDAEEARALGESVYPASTPVSTRWSEPRLVPERSKSGAKRRAWYPGRVLDSRPDGVMLVFAIPAKSSTERRVKVRELSPEEWATASGLPIESAKGFLEIGSYEDETQVILRVEDPVPDWAYLDVDRALRPMSHWKSLKG
ncbi:MAG: tetratricopeptide repeat protein [Myxococcaceae bacterium]